MKTIHWQQITAICLLLISSLAFASDQADETLSLHLRSGNDISIKRFGDSGPRILWLPAERGMYPEVQTPLARGMADLDMEVWVTDLHADYFLSPERSSLDKIPAQDMAEIIQQSLPAQQERKLYLFSTSRGGVLAAQGLRAWQQLADTESNPDSRVGGIILAYPNFSAGVPEPGKPDEYLPITFQTRAPIYLLQPEKSARRWYLDGLEAALRQGGSEVFTQYVPDAGDGYLQRPERTEDELMAANVFPAELKQALAQLDTVQLSGPAGSKATDQPATAEATPGQAATGLQPYPGEQTVPTLQLTDTTGKQLDLKDYRGKVVLLNFWATWCPPCVKEIPSLNRLQAKLAGEDFAILSVEVGEEPEEVKTFLETTPADYPVMLNTDGETAKDWGLRAFPTTFIIDRQGIIRLAYYGGLEWDEDDVVGQLRGVLAQ